MIMNKKLSLLLIVPVLLLFCPAYPAWGQYIPNAPFKSPELRAPDFSLKDLNGKVFKLSSQRGKPVLLFFGTTWCPSCRKQLPLYKEIYGKYSGRGLEVIYINIMEPKGKVAKFVRANALPFRTLLDESGEVANNYEVIGVPTIIVIDREGKIIKASHSTDDLPLQKLFPVKK
jgi:peroxiredoxin